MIQFILNKHLLKREYAWLGHDYQMNNSVHLYLSKKSCIGINGLYCVIDRYNIIEEIPLEALTLPYENLEYELFLSEKAGKTDTLYLKQPPFNKLELLTNIQNKAQQNNDIKDILKITITNGSIEFQTISISEIEPLF